MSAIASGVLKKRTEPLEGEITLLEMLGGGSLVNSAAEELGISRYTAHDRLRRLKFLSGKITLPGLVHWGLTTKLISYECHGLKEYDAHKTLIVQRLGHDWPEKKIRAKMFMTQDQFEGHVKRARWAVGATTRANLVAIYWTEGWII